MNLFLRSSVLNMMRWCLVLLVGLLCSAAQAQMGPIFLKVRTDVTIDIRKHPVGADMVEITMRDPNYPPDLLRSQIAKFDQVNGTPSRGVVVGTESVPSANGGKFAFLKATFATDGIIEPNGAFKIEPFLKAFAGAPAPYTIQGLTIDFEDQTPTGQTVEQFNKPGVVMGEGRYTSTGVLKGIEYRIQLLTQDPNQIIFPDRHESKPTLQPAAPPTKNQSNTALIVLIVLAGLAGGALVYFAMLRTGPKAP